MKFSNFINEKPYDEFFYKGLVKEMMIDAYKWDADPTKISDKEIKRFAKKMNLNYKYFKEVYDGMKNEWEDIKKQEYGN